MGGRGRSGKRRRRVGQGERRRRVVAGAEGLVVTRHVVQLPVPLRRR